MILIIVAGVYKPTYTIGTWGSHIVWKEAFKSYVNHPYRLEIQLENPC